MRPFSSRLEQPENTSAGSSCSTCWTRRLRWKPGPAAENGGRIRVRRSRHIGRVRLADSVDTGPSERWFTLELRSESSVDAIVVLRLASGWLRVIPNFIAR